MSKKRCKDTEIKAFSHCILSFQWLDFEQCLSVVIYLPSLSIKEADEACAKERSRHVQEAEDELRSKAIKDILKERMKDLMVTRPRTDAVGNIPRTQGQLSHPFFILIFL